MRRTIFLALTAAALACNGQSSSTETDASTGSSTAEATTTTTSGGTSTTAVTTSDASGSTSSSTGPAPACETSAMECGVSVDEQMSFCPDPPPASGSLLLEVLGPGKIRVSELGYDSACGLTITPVVKFGPNNSIVISYEIGGQPMDNCICKYTISSVLSNVPSGTWSVTVGPHFDMVDVP